MVFHWRFQGQERDGKKQLFCKAVSKGVNSHLDQQTEANSVSFDKMKYGAYAWSQQSHAELQAGSKVPGKL